MSQCRSCGAAIWFERVNQRWVPVDAGTGGFHRCPGSNQGKPCRVCGRPIRFRKNGVEWCPVDADTGALHSCWSGRAGGV